MPSTNAMARPRFVARNTLACVVLFVAALFANAAPARGQDDPAEVLDSIAWQVGPAVAKLGDIAELRVPKGFRFAGAQDTMRLMELMENPTDGSELGLVAPNDFSWFAIFEFDRIGYVRDDEGADLDADAILESIRAGNEQANRERRKRGWAPLEVVGWEEPPRYDRETNVLVWAVRGESEGEPVINYTTRRLGRSGVMRVTLLVDPPHFRSALSPFRKVMRGFTFRSGSRYGDFEVGDKVAEYGLTALITGGAVAVAVKSGLFKWLLRIIGLAGVAVAAVVKRALGSVSSLSGESRPDGE